MRQNRSREYNVCACRQITPQGGYFMRCRRRQQVAHLQRQKVARPLQDVGKGRLAAPACRLSASRRPELKCRRLQGVYKLDTL